ncbi:hypothetical protein B0T14DRAFT_184054 [Immersiella caudata]|uniref:RRM domain-containing protein n=1 Tax=Immersiella caudata TaxID=314043 RepID=A0AA40C3D3_9PEZI|nr:hypothetical protein B0T14DRAFT_184054 [Immersiella caudata]
MSGQPNDRSKRKGSVIVGPAKDDGNYWVHVGGLDINTKWYHLNDYLAPVCGGPKCVYVQGPFKTEDGTFEASVRVTNRKNYNAVCDLLDGQKYLFEGLPYVVQTNLNKPLELAMEEMSITSNKAATASASSSYPNTSAEYTEPQYVPEQYHYTNELEGYDGTDYQYGYVSNQAAGHSNQEARTPSYQQGQNYYGQGSSGSSSRAQKNHPNSTQTSTSGYKASSKPASRPSTAPQIPTQYLMITGFPSYKPSVSRNDIRKAMRKVMSELLNGDVKDYMTIPEQEGWPYSYCYVRFSDWQDAKQAKEAIDGAELRLPSASEVGEAQAVYVNDITGKKGKEKEKQPPAVMDENYKQPAPVVVDGSYKQPAPVVVDGSHTPVDNGPPTNAPKGPKDWRDIRVARGQRHKEARKQREKERQGK